MNEWMIEWMNDRMKEWSNEWMNDRMKEWSNGGMNKWSNEWMNDQMNEWMNVRRHVSTVIMILVVMVTWCQFSIKTAESRQLGWTLLFSTLEIWTIVRALWSTIMHKLETEVKYLDLSFVGVDLFEFHLSCSDECSDSLFVCFFFCFFLFFVFCCCLDWDEILKETSFSQGIVFFFDVQNK